MAELLHLNAVAEHGLAKVGKVGLARPRVLSEVQPPGKDVGVSRRVLHAEVEALMDILLVGRGLFAHSRVTAEAVVDGDKVEVALGVLWQLQKEVTPRTLR